MSNRSHSPDEFDCDSCGERVPGVPYIHPWDDCKCGSFDGDRCKPCWWRFIKEGT